MKNKNIEVEGGELLLQSEEGHYAIIPAKHRREVEDMIKDGCDNCLNDYIHNLPLDRDYAEDGTIIENPPTKKEDSSSSDDLYDIIFNKKSITEKYGYVPERKSVEEKIKDYSSGVDIRKTPGIVSDVVKDRKNAYEEELLNKKKVKEHKEEEFRKQWENNTSELTQGKDNKIQEEYTDAVLNPSIPQQIFTGMQLPLRYTDNPIKLVGDVVSLVAPESHLAKDLPNTKEDILEFRRKQLDPNATITDKIANTANEMFNLTVGSLSNLGLAEFGYLTKLAKIPKFAPFLEAGSNANTAANVMGGFKNISDILSKDDTNYGDYLDLLSNIAGTVVKSGNVDTGNSIGNVLDPRFRTNFRNMTRKQQRDLLIDLTKDVTSHGLNTTDQLKRLKNE